MTQPLALCAACARHVRVSERHCPFCGAARAPAGPVSARPSTGSLALAGALLAAAVSAHDTAEAQPLHPRLGSDHASTASGYGGPPAYPGYFPGIGRPGLEPPSPQPTPVLVSPPTARVRVNVAVSLGGPRAGQLTSVLRARTALWARCQPSTASLPAHFEVRLRLTVGPNGRVRADGFPSTPPALDPVVRCLVSRLRSVQLSPGPEAEAEVAMTYGTPAPPAPPRRPAPPSTSRCGPSPAGCRSTGCGAGMVCERRAQCRPSSCGCNAETGQWVCTSDCGGGVCVPAPRSPR